MGAGVVGEALNTDPSAGVTWVGVDDAPPRIGIGAGAVDWLDDDHGPGIGVVGHAPMGPASLGTLMVGSSHISGMTCFGGLLSVSLMAVVVCLLSWH